MKFGPNARNESYMATAVGDPTAAGFTHGPMSEVSQYGPRLHGSHLHPVPGTQIAWTPPRLLTGKVEHTVSTVLLMDRQLLTSMYWSHHRPAHRGSHPHAVDGLTTPLASAG